MGSGVSFFFTFFVGEVGMTKQLAKLRSVEILGSCGAEGFNLTLRFRSFYHHWHLTTFKIRCSFP